MDNIIADKSKVKYVNENIKMVMFLYSGEDSERLLKREFREEIDGVVLVEGRGERHRVKAQREVVNVILRMSVTVIVKVTAIVTNMSKPRCHFLESFVMTSASS